MINNTLINFYINGKHTSWQHLRDLHKKTHKGRTFLCGSLPAMESPYATSYCPSYMTSNWVGPMLPSLTEVSFLLFLTLWLIVHEYYFPCHLFVFSLNFTIVSRHVLLLNIGSQPTRPYTINTRPYFSPAVILEKNRPGDEAKRTVA